MRTLPVTCRAFLILVFLGITELAQAQSDFMVVRERVMDEILDQPVQDERIRRIVASIRPDGSWPGIDYVDVSNTGFEHSVHLRNMVLMSLAYNNPASRFFSSDELEKYINRSLLFWADHDFICENWWYNQIGTPQSLVAVLLLMDGHIDPSLKEKTLKIIQRANLNAPGARPGGDRIKIGGIEAKSVLATGDTARFARIMQVINDEIRFNTGDRGMQIDYSFHHRVDRVNNTVSYGLGYAEAFAEWACYVEGTTYAFSDEKIRQLVDYYLDGICKQYIYGIYTDPGVRNRDVSRRDSFRPHSTEIPDKLLQVTGYRSKELQEIVRLRRGRTDPSGSFSKFFWQSEHFIFQRPGFYTSVRMYSVRNRNMEEPYNSEGLRNHHKGDGANFISLRGDEYLNIWPVYDWQKIPGATILQKAELPPPEEIQKDGVTTFVGAVTDGRYGAAGFDFISPHDPVKARKSWFFFDEEYVCLGAGIESNARFPVATTLNQCLLNGPVVLKDDLGERVLEKGEHVLEDVKWIYHDGLGYLFPEDATVRLSNRIEKGSWWNISHQWDTSLDTLEMEVFKLWVDHGSRPQGRRGGLVNEPMIARDVTYQYVVIPRADVDQMNSDRGIQILANNRWVQGVKHRDLGLVEVIFYRAGKLKISEQMEIQLDSPGALIIQMEDASVKQISAADPSRLNDRLHLSISGQLKAEESAENLQMNFDHKAQVTHLAIDLPAGVEAGSSVTLKFQDN
jgi:chondroitin AC lyase